MRLPIAAVAIAVLALPASVGASSSAEGVTRIGLLMDTGDDTVVAGGRRDPRPRVWVFIETRTGGERSRVIFKSRLG